MITKHSTKFDILTKNNQTSSSLLIDTLVGQIKLNGIERIEFKKHQTTMPIAFLVTLAYEISSAEKKHSISQKTHLPN